MATVHAEKPTNLFGVDKPAKHDIEAVRPHIRKHLRLFTFPIKPGVDARIFGTSYRDAEKRLNAMTFPLHVLPFRS